MPLTLNDLKKPSGTLPIVEKEEVPTILDNRVTSSGNISIDEEDFSDIDEKKRSEERRVGKECRL